jgi:phosphatidylserine/phosphatidylglycerophosphate/cardiolipin synthase-like enzyme
MARRSRTSPTKGDRHLPLGRIAPLTAVLVLVALTVCVLSGCDLAGLLGELEGTPGAATLPATTTGSGGSWWQVYFTDPSRVNNPDDLRGSIPEKLIGYINDAQHTIHVAAYEFDLTPVAEALVAAHQRGVEVEWVTDDEYGIEVDQDPGHGQFAMLERAGIPVKDDARGALMHDKFWIFDDQVVWTGSTNITVNGNFRNNNNVLVITSPAVAAIYEREFAEMWAGQFGPTSPSTAGSQAVTIEGTPVQILFAPEDKVISHLVPLLKGAQKSIRFMAFSFTNDEMATAMIERANAGVDVQGIFETRGSETQYSEMPPLYCAGVPVRQDGNPATFHHKVLIIDDQTVVTGSFNFTANADESNDENVVIVANRDIAAQYLQEFERRWQEATAPDAQDVQCAR